MSEIRNIPNIVTNSAGIPNIQVQGAELIQVNGNEVQFVGNIQSTDTSIIPIGVREIADARIFESSSPTVIPPTVPVSRQSKAVS